MRSIDLSQVDWTHIGKPDHFNVDHYLDSVEQMICCDELETALYMLDHLPGYYRNFVPQRALDIKAAMYRQLMSVVDYANDKHEAKEANEEIHHCPIEKQWETPHFFPRGPAAIRTVKELNDQGFSVHVTEFGPANYWLPYALKDQGCDFSYDSYSINSSVKYLEPQTPSDKPKKHLFCCFEVIEHLWNHDDVYHHYAKAQINADVIMISTPKHTLFGGRADWKERELGHVRTYTPGELINFGNKHWQGYDWQLFDAYMMVLIGKKR